MILEYSVVRGMGRLARVRVRWGDWRGLTTSYVTPAGDS
jgi:hypothetical protein